LRQSGSQLLGCDGDIGLGVKEVWALRHSFFLLPVLHGEKVSAQLTDEGLFRVK
jgi:hypothetical protein